MRLPQSSSHRLIWSAIALVALVVTAHSSALAAGWIWDDDYYVTENLTLRSLEGLRRIWFERGAVPQYYPMTHTTFWVEYRLWGLNPAGYHAVNIALHAANTLLLWNVLRWLRFPGAFIAAAFFGVHPIHVESVAWVTERKNALSGFFYLLALLAYFKSSGFRNQGSVNGDGRDLAALSSAPRTLNPLYYLALALFILALLSKSVTSSLPAAVLLLIYGFRGRITLRDVWPLVPFFVLGMIAGWNTSQMERDVVGARGPEWDFSFIERCLIAGRAVWFYAHKLLWPHLLIFTYPRWDIDVSDPSQYIWPVIAVTLVFVLFLMRHRWSRWPLVAVLFFGGTLFPALGFVDLLPMRYSFVADHFAYLASIGLIALAAAGIAQLMTRHPALMRSAAAIALLALSIKTWTHARDFADAETLWVNTIRKNPNAWMARNNLAVIHLDQGEINSAEAQLRASLRINPANAEAVMNLGRVAALRGDPQQAIKHYRDAAEMNPNYPQPHYNLGVAYSDLGDVARAIEAYQRALELDPGHVPTLNNLGILFFKAGQPQPAIDLLRRAIDRDPANASAHRNLANALDAVGRSADAERHRRLAQSIDPENAVDLNNQGIRLAQQGDLDAALQRFERAIELRPDLHEAHLNRGLALEKLGQTAEAIIAYRRAAELKTNDPRASQALQRLLNGSAD